MTTQGTGEAPARRSVGRGLVYAGTVFFFIGLFAAAIVTPNTFGVGLIVTGGVLFAVGLALRVGTSGDD
jgi:hypothetical protein